MLNWKRGNCRNLHPAISWRVLWLHSTVLFASDEQRFGDREAFVDRDGAGHLWRGMPLSLLLQCERRRALFRHLLWVLLCTLTQCV